MGYKQPVQETKRFAWLAHVDASCKDSPISAPTINAVQLTLERPCWTPDRNHMWPARFKACARLCALC